MRSNFFREVFVFFILVGFVFMFVSFFGVASGFQGSSDSYSVDTKQDSFAQTNSTGGDFSSRLIGGIAAVGEYAVNLLAGRFGILTSTASVQINITSHSEGEEVVRGNDAVTGEDDKGVVSDSVNLTARVFSSSSGVSGSTCYFYDDGGLLGSGTTNSSGHCSVSYGKGSFDAGTRTIDVNYTVGGSYTKSNVNDTINVSIVRYVATLDMDNLRDNGKYYDGDTAILNIEINKVTSSSTANYDPQNLSANATNAAENVYSDGSHFYPGNISRSGVGLYAANVTVNYSFGSFIRWDVLESDDSFQSYIGSAVHSDKAICVGDFGDWSSWSECSGGTQTRSRTDSSDCTEVQTQSCTTGGDDSGGGGGGGVSCTFVGWGDWSDWGLCIDGEQTRTRTDNCGRTEEDVRSCEGEICTDNIDNDNDGFIDCDDSDCEGSIDCQCVPDWQCSWSACEDDGSGNYYSTPSNCFDANLCGVSESMPTRVQCALDREGKYVPVTPQGDECLPLWNCGGWSKCQADYNLKDILRGDTTLGGTQYRTCEDVRGCVSNTIDKRSCSLALPVKVTKTKWCFDDYIEIHDVSSGRLVSRVQEDSRGELTRVDIGFVATEFEGYCGYCYDGIKNYDEEGVDCGGSGCVECIDKGTFFDWMYYVKIALWIILLILVLVGLYENRKTISKRVPRRKIRFGMPKIRLPSLKVHVKFKMPKFRRAKPAKVVKKPVAKPRKIRMPSLGIGKWFKSLFAVRRARFVERKKARVAKRAAKKKARVEKKIFRKEKKSARREARRVKKRIKKKDIRQSEVSDLRKKLEEWKSKGYYDTSKLRKKLDEYEG